ncbi:MAG: tRNA pseudouridine(13) synthase TruD [Gemmata sp.]|nr:tRNA pseudouridine(13) synthase TruD [Gemmata sp.]
MKLKQRPDDFRVEELTDAQPEAEGEFAFYRLDKTGWTTLDALAVIRRRWHIDHRRVSYGGLKDRHAVTTQYLTIFRGPPRDLSQHGIRLSYLGRRKEPYTSQCLRANRFQVTLRAMNEAAVDRATAAMHEVHTVGVPNYFDDQRFGSVGPNQEFVGREMVCGRFERALWLALAAPYEYDRAAAKREKEQLRASWGRWSECLQQLPRGHARSLISYLATHPTDFRGAVARLRPELRGLYLSAYQSHLWNRMLALWLRHNCGEDELVELALKIGRLPAPRRVPDETTRSAWTTLALPLPSARLRPDTTAVWWPLVQTVLGEEGLTLGDLKVKGMQKPFFAKGDRAACVFPAHSSLITEWDELHRGQKKLILRFELPKGSYATIVVKRLTAFHPPAA